MKTTMIIRDDLLRRAKARAALRGQPLSRFLETSLERALREDEPPACSWAEWAAGLPKVSRGAAKGLREVLGEAHFRTIDPEMWK